MSVYIPGMEMPTSCCNCPLAKLSPTGETLICNYTLSTVPWDDKPFDCPLVPVPEHGRLIDADAMTESVKTQTEFVKLLGGREMAEIAGIIERNFLKEVNNAPTIIPADKEGER